MSELVLILDFKGTNVESVAQMVREANVYTEVMPNSVTIPQILEKKPIGIIIYGGLSEFDADFSGIGIPVLIVQSSDISPEVLHSFLFVKCEAMGEYDFGKFIDKKTQEIRDAVGDKKVLLALSGGVDSSVCAALLSKAIPGQLVCVFVDHGFMRKNEGDDIAKIFEGYDMDFVRVNAEDRFLAKLDGVSDPEQKRAIIGEEFIRVFEEEAKKLGKIPFFAQGTIYPDIIESGGASGELIKSHHNVGGLPENLDFEMLIEPLSTLYKYEVRNVGLMLGLPPELVNRQPFPGPGLAVRIMGAITREKLSVVREADAIVCEELGKLAPAERPNQYFAVLTNTESVGVKNNKRTHDAVLAVRAVTTQDFMTASYSPIPHEILGHISSRISTEIQDVSRVVYDISSKPPGTVEWQ